MQNPCGEKPMRTPPGTASRLGLVMGGGYFVFVAPPPVEPGPHLLDVLGRPGELTTLLTHDAGVSWTDRRGVALAEATLQAGGAVVMQFATLADALAAHRRLQTALAA